jgi:DNA transformation protein
VIALFACVPEHAPLTLDNRDSFFRSVRMPVTPAYRDYVLEQLARTGRVTSRRMFGALGLYCDDRFFGIIDDDTLYLKVGDETRPEYEARGMQPFRPYEDKPVVSMSYYTVPADILDDAEELVQWARRSVAIASIPKPARRKAPARAPQPASKPASKPARKKRRS